MAMNLSYYVYVSDRGSAFATAIATVLAEALTELGHDSVYPAAGLPEPGRDRINLVVAPHEFFSSHGGHSERELLDAARVSVTVGVEQPGTASFDLAARYASVGPMALDISQDGV